MTTYENLKVETSSGGKLESFTKVNLNEVSRIKANFPSMPKDYLVFLTEIGFGEIKGNVFMIYSGLTTPDQVFDEESAEELKNIVFFGDDFSGFSYGFDMNDNWSVVEVDSVDLEIDKVADTFEEFIRDKLQSLGD